MQDELKNIWESASQPVEISDERVEKIINKKSLNLVEKLTKAVRFEHIFNMIVSPLLVAICVWMEVYKLALILSAMLIPILLYYHFLIEKLYNHRIELNVYEYLKESYATLKRFILHYYLAAIFILLISLYAGYELGETMLGNHIGVIDQKSFNEDIYYWSVVAIISIALAYLFIYLLYGRKLRRLKKIIKELES